MAGVKLDWERVEEIREAWEGGESQRSLCRRFGVSVVTIGSIVRGETWQGLNAAPPVKVLRPGRLKQMDDPDAILQRLLATQEQVNQRLTPKPAISLLDGGDLPDETGGSGLAKLGQTRQEMKDEGTL